MGGILGALLLWGTFNCSPLYSTSRTGLGTDGWGSASHIHISAGGAFLVEVVLTAVFVFAVLQATSRAANATTAGVVVGFALTMVHLIGIPITGTSVNPARSLGPALIVGGTALSQVWLFIVAPLVGGAVAAGLHRLLYPEMEESLASGDLPTAAVDRRSRSFLGQTGIEGNRTGKWNRRKFRPGLFRAWCTAGRSNAQRRGGSDLGLRVVQGWHKTPVLVSNWYVRDQKPSQAPGMTQRPGEYVSQPR